MLVLCALCGAREIQDSDVTLAAGQPALVCLTFDQLAEALSICEQSFVKHYRVQLIKTHCIHSAVPAPALLRKVLQST